MRITMVRVVMMLSVAWASIVHAETPAEFEAKGAEALALSQAEPDAILSAALFYGKASAGFDAAGDEAKAVEMNSYLYWCKKKMTSDQMTTFLKHGETDDKEIVARLQSADKTAKPSDAKVYFDRAEAFSRNAPDEHLRIAIRFFEVADRFADSDIGKQAMRQCLKETMLASKGGTTPTTAVSAAEAPKRLAAPKPAELKTAEKELKELFKDDLAKVKPAEKAEFARKLSAQADETKDNSAGRFEMRILAIAQAAQSGDTALMLSMFDKLDADFDGDFKETKRSSFSTLASANRMPAVGKFASDSKTLLDHPADLAANLGAGHYLCFSAGDFERGLPLLAKSSHSVWSKLAKEDLKNPQDGAAQIALGDSWWDASEKGSDAEEKRHAQERAASWYTKALPTVSGLTKVKLEKRINAAGTPKAPAENVAVSGGAKVDLLKLIDPEKDTVKGTWTLVDGKLVSDKTGYCRIEIPYKPPEEYDFRIVFTRTEGKDFIGQILYKSEHQFTWVMDGFGDTISGLDVLNGKRFQENETTVKGKLLMNNQPQSSIVQVRKSGVTVQLNGKSIVKLATNYSDLRIWEQLKLRNSSVLGLAEWNNEVSFSVVELIEITGTGKKTR